MPMFRFASTYIYILHSIILYSFRTNLYFSSHKNCRLYLFIWKMLAEIPGVDFMITIFCDFPQFSAKKLAFFLNINVMIKYFFKI
jgi:hypothetical protein